MIAIEYGSRLSPLILTVVALGTSSGLWAQAPAPTAAVQATARPHDPALEPGRGNQTIERIRTEDAGSRIDELRVGGQTQSIVVQPKGDMPAYEVRPMDARPGSTQGGTRVWNFLRF
jgi:hypothetical protein